MYEKNSRAEKDRAYMQSEVNNGRAAVDAIAREKVLFAVFCVCGVKIETPEMFLLL